MARGTGKFNLRLGDGTYDKNYWLHVPDVADGTLKLTQGDESNVLRDVLTVDNSGNMSAVQILKALKQVRLDGGAASGGLRIMGSTPGGSEYAANSAILDNNTTGQFRLFACGPDASTRGTLSLNMVKSDGSGAVSALSIDNTGIVTNGVRTVTPFLTISTAQYSAAVSTTGWTAGNWYTAIPNGNLTQGVMFLISCRWIHGGGGAPYVVTFSLIWTGCETNGGGTGNVFRPLCSSHLGSATELFDCRSISGSASNAGLQVSPNFTMAGTLYVNVYQLTP